MEGGQIWGEGWPSDLKHESMVFVGEKITHSAQASPICYGPSSKNVKVASNHALATCTKLNSVTDSKIERGRERGGKGKRDREREREREAKTGSGERGKKKR